MQYGSNQVLTSLLRDVSRSFYLTLRVLPSSIRPQIGLAYLLARTADTIADTDLLRVDERLAALRALRESIAGTSPAPQFHEWSKHQASVAEAALLSRYETSLELLRGLSVTDCKLVVEVLGTIIGGQELDLVRFGSESHEVRALQTAEELDDYTYRVAGCVGEFWTKMCLAHLFASAQLDVAGLLARGIRFGKGLQLVNILRDLPADLRKGRCYLPETQLRAKGLAPADLLEPRNEDRLRPVYDFYLEVASEHLAAGWQYTNSLPRSGIRVRLACAWPLIIGRRTIDLLRQGRILDPGQRIKLSRREVKGVMWRSVLYYLWPARWNRLFQGPCSTH
ncbi:MAG TPA: phytoene/squalene synthase family protein [Verrucomicrobiae bacterium]|jgi:farnesyl-diphosphate farnesyltransferase|nr:phytoene/squalene synthase family protein [Verrucomicrobiae bacterium]